MDRCNEGSSKMNLRDARPKKIPVRAIKKILSRRKICVTGSMIKYYNILEMIFNIRKNRILGFVIKKKSHKTSRGSDKESNASSNPSGSEKK